MLKDVLDILFKVMRVSETYNTDFIKCFCLDDDYNAVVMDTILVVIREKGISTVGMEADMCNFMKLVSLIIPYNITYIY